MLSFRPKRLLISLFYLTLALGLNGCNDVPKDESTPAPEEKNVQVQLRDVADNVEVQ